MEGGQATNIHSPMAFSQQSSPYSQLRPQRNSNSPIQRPIQYPGYLMQKSDCLSSQQQLQQNVPYRAISPASSTTSDSGSRYNNSSFQGRQTGMPVQYGAAMPAATFNQGHRTSPGLGGQVNVAVTNSKPSPLRNNMDDCRLTVNPVANYAIGERDDPQSWAPLLNAARQESSL